MTRDGKLIADLWRALETAVHHAEAMGCTCNSNEQYNTAHSKRRRHVCTGVDVALDAEPVLKRARKRLSKENRQ